MSDEVRKTRERQRRAAGRGVILGFAVGAYVLVARERKQGITPKLVNTWTGPWRVVTAATEHVYGVKNIVSGEVRDVHVARMRFYADRYLDLTAERKDVFQHTFTQGYVEMTDVLELAEADDRTYIVPVDWKGFEEDERTWEPVENIWRDAPEFLQGKLREMRPSAKVRRSLSRKYGIKL